LLSGYDHDRYRHAIDRLDRLWQLRDVDRHLDRRRLLDCQWQHGHRHRWLQLDRYINRHRNFRRMRNRIDIDRHQHSHYRLDDGMRRLRQHGHLDRHRLDWLDWHWFNRHGLRCGFDRDRHGRQRHRQWHVPRHG
jgi:hypothetical protein